MRVRFCLPRVEAEGDGKIRSAHPGMSPSPQASLLPQVGGDGLDRKGKNTPSPVMLLADGRSWGLPEP